MGGVCKILFYRLKKGARYPQFYVRGVETKARAEKLIEVLTGIPRVTPMSDGGIKISGSWRGARSLERR
jgi:hypothetical protein